MADLTFVTGNPLKFAIASSAFVATGITLTQKNLDIDEIQSEDSEYITRKKAEAAYAILQKPLVVNDDSWSIPGLNGFPGPYMKSMNHWLTTEDWLRLTATLSDRRVELTQIIVYQDEKGQYVCENTIRGEILPIPHGDSDSHTGESGQFIITMDGDEGLSIAEAVARDIGHYNTRPAAKVWQKFAAWYMENKGK